MKQSQIDYLNFRAALKSNYVKGVHTLRSILADNAQARMFAENPAAVAVVLSYDTENPDKNAVELHNLLSKSSVAEIASNTYICNTYGVANFGELFEDEELMATAIEDDATMNAIVSSKTAMESIATNSGAMESVTGSETAMASVASSEVAMETIVETPSALSALVSSETAMAAVAASEVSIGVITTSSSAMEAIAASQVAANAVIASDIAMTAMSQSSTAMSAMADSSTAMAIVVESSAASATFAGSSVAMAELAGSDVAMKAIASSSTAMPAMAASAIALNAICKVSAARTSWMNSSYAHTYYDTVYETLHNSSDDLFLKYESHYSSPMSDVDIANASGGGSDYPYYTNASGGWSSTKSSSRTHNNAVPFAGITLANQGTSDATNMVAYFGSSQTKANLANITAYDEYLDVKKVCVGGLSLYSSYTYPGLCVGASFATYAAV